MASKVRGRQLTMEDSALGNARQHLELVSPGIGLNVGTGDTITSSSGSLISSDSLLCGTGPTSGSLLASANMGNLHIPWQHQVSVRPNSAATMLASSISAIPDNSCQVPSNAARHKLAVAKSRRHRPPTYAVAANARIGVIFQSSRASCVSEPKKLTIDNADDHGKDVSLGADIKETGDCMDEISLAHRHHSRMEAFANEFFIPLAQQKCICINETSPAISIEENDGERDKSDSSQESGMKCKGQKPPERLLATDQARTLSQSIHPAPEIPPK
ncbi:unnamed protein product [Protopolystoma xenopodis]|uniref:Uncharacterized protein n=1 Tax=Protopolystoma xenopodis TaxID=117903 RepID=A0A448WV59_9PLAT|nr:unnamed protein product [Protopolystoma xenopodis]